MDDNLGFCLLCMEVHLIKIITVPDTEIYKGQEVTFDAEYEYCEYADGYLENEEQIRKNWESMRKARGE